MSAQPDPLLPSSPLLQLPPDVLKQILMSVSQQDRLCSCSLVCKQLQKAAAAATDTLVLQHKQRFVHAPMQEAAAYLQHHGDFLTCLEVQGWGKPTDWLPCRNLQRLQISNGVLSAPADHSSLSGLESLTHLGFTDVKFAAQEQAELFASHTVHLQELVTEYIKGGRVPLTYNQRVEQSRQPYTFDVLPLISSLTRLELRESCMPLSFLQHVSALTSLQSLSLSSHWQYHAEQKVGHSQAAAGVIAPLTSLTRLELKVALMGDEYLEHLTRLTCLQSLRIYSVYVTEAAFSNVTSLQQLKTLDLAVSGDFDDTVAPFFKSLTALQDLQIVLGTDDAWVVDATMLHHLTTLTAFELKEAAVNSTELLLLLAKLTQLETLHLEWSVPDQTPSWPPASAAYEAITASSQLQQLTIAMAKFPKGVWQHVFHAGRQLWQLTKLQIDVPNYMDDDDVPSEFVLPFTSADLDSCVTCCPELRTLTIAQQDGPQLTALQRLSALSTLCIWHLDDQRAVLDLAALTQLRSLSVIVAVSAGLWLPGLKSLTALKQLKELDYREKGALSWLPDTERARLVLVSKVGSHSHHGRN